MKSAVISFAFLALLRFSEAGPLRLQKRAAFYIANETACVVDNLVYSSGDPIPTDDPCEACKCRPPGFACILKECDVKPGCRAIRRAGYCCPEYVCGCEHNGRMYRDGDLIVDSKNPCYTCHCQGTSIACAFVDCFFRVDCTPMYAAGECCPHYDHCSTLDSDDALHTLTPFIEVKDVDQESLSSVYSRPSTSTELSVDLSELSITEEDLSGVWPTISTEIPGNVPEILFDVIKTPVAPFIPSDQDPFISKPEKPETISTEQSEGDTDVEIINKEAVEETKSSSGESSDELVADIIISLATEPPPAIEERPFVSAVEPQADIQADTVTPELQPDIPNNTALPELSEELETEVNEIKKSRSLENGTSNEDGESKITESKEQLESGDTEEIKIAEVSTIKNLIENTSEDSTVTEIQPSTTAPQTSNFPLEDPNLKEEVKFVETDQVTTQANAQSKKLYYNADVGTSSESVETVTTVVHVKQEASTGITDAAETTSPPNTSKDDELNLFISAVEKLEEHKQVDTENLATTSPKEEIEDFPLDKSGATSAEVPPVSISDEEGKVEKQAITEGDKATSQQVTDSETPEVLEIKSSTTQLPELSDVESNAPTASVDEKIDIDN